jgi:hypothetical protein
VLQLVAKKIDHLLFGHGLELHTPGLGADLYAMTLDEELQSCRRRLPFVQDESRA